MIGGGAPIESANKDGWRPLHFAARHGHVALVRQLIEVGADINALTIAHETALLWAVFSGRAATAQVLVEAPGADLNIVEDTGNAALDYAISKNLPAIAAAIRARGGLLGTEVRARLRAAPPPVVAPALAAFAVGDRVEGKWRGLAWYPGRISAAGASFAINYDDGDKEDGIPADRIRAMRLVPAEPAAPAAFFVGDRVEGNWRGLGWFPGHISATREGGSFSITYDDGDKEEGVPADQIRALRPAPVAPAAVAPAAAAPAAFAVGERVMGRWSKGRGWYRARIVAVLDGQLYDLDYEDGDKDRGLPDESVRAIRAGE